MAGVMLDRPDLSLQQGRSRVARWFAARPRVADVAVILACSAPPAAALILEPRHPVWLGWACVVVVAIVFWWRRSHPLPVLLIVAGVASLNPVYAASLAGPTTEIIFGLFALASRVRLRTALIGAAAAALIVLGVSWAAMWIGIRATPPIAWLQPFAVAALAAGVAVRTARGRRETLEQVVALREERAAVAERARITAEMHDVVAHSVTVMVALAGGAAAGWEKHPERARAALDQLGEVGAGALEEMQRILHVLRDSDPDLVETLETAGHTAPTLDELVEVFRRTGLPVTLDVNTELPADPGLRTAVHRIVRESLTNVLRHGIDVTYVEVRVAVTDSELVVTVTDNGRGGANPNIGVGAGVGLTALRERARAFGGELTAAPLPGAHAGWQTRAVLPVQLRRS